MITGSQVQYQSLNFKASFLLLISIFMRICFTVAKERSHYVAAVVEYQPEGNPWDLTPAEILTKNVNNYKVLIKQASSENADIIVFPEYGLTTLGIPRDRKNSKPFLLYVPPIGSNPCENDIEFVSIEVQDLACSARTWRIYVVVNLGEIRSCNLSDDLKCPTDGVFHYNTNVVFDRQGTIVAKYEKANLYFEDQFDKPNPIQLSTFTSDFGIVFGLFTCFDVIFYDPAIKLLETGRLRNFIFPTAWVDELPFLTGIQAQALWAHSSNSNLLSSGYHQPLGGQMGSGIYSGKNGALNYTFNPDSGTQLVIAEVPTQPNAQITSNKFFIDLNFKQKENSKAHHSFLREDLQNYTSKLLLHERIGLQKDNVCTENGFCCKIVYEFSPKKRNFVNSGENYRLVAFNGTRTVAAKTSQFDWQVCGIVRCLNLTLESCSENEKSSSEANLPNLKFLQLQSTFDLHKSFLPGNNLLDVQMNLIPHEYFVNELNLDQNYMAISSYKLSSVAITTVAMINKLYCNISYQN